MTTGDAPESPAGPAGGMTGAAVLAVLAALAGAGLPAWLDGGWGVDALLGEQTRPHGDVDLVLALDRTGDAIAALTALGFAVALDGRPTRLVLRDAGGRQVDVHPVTLDAAGNGSQAGAAPDGGDCLYPAAGFVSGTVAGHPVGCLSAAVQVAHHTGYPPTPKDRLDVGRLHRRFGVPLPEAYRQGP